MRTTIEMAREAAGDDWGLFQEYMPEIHRLVELVRADERARMAEHPAQQEPVAWVPYLSDRADGVSGHYAIARWNPRGYREVWNLRRHAWGAYSDDVLSLEEADTLLRLIEIPTRKVESPQPAQQEPVPWSQALENVWAEPDDTTPQPAQQKPVALSWVNDDGFLRKKPSEQTAKQEPVAWIWEGRDGYATIELIDLDEQDMQNVSVKSITPIYTSPQHTWVGLTHDEYDAICDKHSTMSDFDFLEDIEAKLRGKNS